jgi:DNA-binding NarL/FixJ family response regulator
LSSTEPSVAEAAAVAAYLAGRDDDCDRAWEAAHRAALAADDVPEAARYAFWLALCLMLRGQMARAGGWLGRAEALLAEARGECAASGYVLIPAFLGALDSGAPETARELAIDATDIANRVGDADLRAFAVLAHGQALIALGDTSAGTARLDEVMTSVIAGEVGAITAGIVYCAVILECMALFDLSRAAEWTGALSAWCDRQSGLVPYRGQCLVHRSQLEQAAGRWTDAAAIVKDACARLSEPPHPALGLAHYQQAELHRLTGDVPLAEAEYRQASRHGHDPMPGLALLQLARGDTDGAATAIRRSLQETTRATERPALLAAAVDILRADGDLAGARDAVGELSALPSSSALLTALAARAMGGVLIDEGDAASALVLLRDSARVLQSLRLPYEAARTSELLASALDILGDHTAAELELSNARETYADLGALPDLTRLDGATGRPATSSLSDREHEVLQHLAAGRTNREIAEALVISPHTVRRHVENIFSKLGVTTRAAATGYAYEHHLL